MTTVVATDEAIAEFRRFRNANSDALGCAGVMPPVSLWTWAKLLKVCSVEPRDFGIEGCLVPIGSSGDTYRVWYRADRPWVRSRFTIAHEFAHIWLAIWRGRSDTCYYRSGATEQDEQLADAVAAELLMPDTYVRAYALSVTRDLAAAGRTRQSPWLAVRSACRRFQVSQLAMLRCATAWQELPMFHLELRSSPLQKHIRVNLVLGKPLRQLGISLISSALQGARILGECGKCDYSPEGFCHKIEFASRKGRIRADGYGRSVHPGKSQTERYVVLGHLRAG